MTDDVSEQASLARFVSPWLITILVLGFAVVVYVKTPDMEARSNIGNYVGGFAGAIAFIWLVAAHTQQARQLTLQRTELSLQRAALDLQHEESKRLRKFAALEQVSNILSQFESGLLQTSKTTIAEVASKFMEVTATEWKVIQSAPTPKEVIAAQSRWMAVYGPCSEFLERFVSAVELYSETTGDVIFQSNGTPAQRIVEGFDRLLPIPLVRHYTGTAKYVADLLELFEPGIDRIMVSGFDALEKLAPGSVRADKAAPFRERLAAREAASSEIHKKNE